MIIDKVSRFLAKNAGKWFSIKEIANKLKLSVSYVSKRLEKVKDKASFYFRSKGKDKEFMYTKSK